MSTRSKSFIFISILNLIFCFCLTPLIWAQANQNRSNDSTSKKLYGSALILTNYVERGITQSDKGLAMQAGFGYQMGSQARIGIWGSSIKFPSNEENLNLRLYFDVKMDFTTNSMLILRYDVNRYFRSDTHDGNIISADFSSFGYHILLDQNSNWEGTSSSATWMGFSKDFFVPYGFQVTPQIGYTQLTTTDYTNYFDAKLEIGYKLAEIVFKTSAHYNSNSAQFNGRGDLAFVFGVLAQF